MKTILAISSLAIAFALIAPLADAALLSVDDVADPYTAPDMRCEMYDAEEIAENGGVMVATFPTPTPGLTVTVHMLCALDVEAPVTMQTDCTSNAYSLTGWAWASAYGGRIDTTNSYGFSSSQVLSTFSASSETWDSAVGANIFDSFTQGGKAKDVRRFDGWNQHGWKGLGGGGTIAVTYTWSSGGNAVESDAAYNTFYGWSLSGAAGKMDLQNIATHELGHTFGMGHSSSASPNSCLTMYPSGNYGETQKRTLGDGDITGINVIY